MKIFLTTACLAATLTMTGCASIFSGSTQTLTFKSVPDTANITITNKSGEKIHTSSTPATVTLKRGNGYFKPAGYEITFSKEGFQTKTVQVKATVNGWYIANIIFGGLIGFLIVDPATGAMYTLSPSDINSVLDPATGAMYTLSPSDINSVLDPAQLSTTKNKGYQSLTVMLVQDISVDIMKRAKYITTL